MPILNATTTRGGDSNATMAANQFEQRVTPTVGAGREVIRHAGFNSGSAANLDEQRKSQEQGSH